MLHSCKSQNVLKVIRLQLQNDILETFVANRRLKSKKINWKSVYILQKIDDLSTRSPKCLII